MSRLYDIINTIAQRTGSRIYKEGTDITTSHTVYTTYDSITVPEGLYLVFAQMTARSGGVGESYRAQINLQLNGNNWRAATSRAINGITTTCMGILTTGGTITMQGYTNFTSDIKADYSLNAIRLSALDN